MCADGACDLTLVADGTACGNDAGTCQQGSCQVACTEQGIRNAIAAGGGPYTFDCADGTTIVTEAEILIDNDVILDGEGNLTVDGNDEHPMFVVIEGVTGEVRRFTVTKSGFMGPFGSAPAIENRGTLILASSSVTENMSGIWNDGTLELTDSTVTGNASRGIYTSGTASVTNSTISGNAGVEGSGIFNMGRLTLTDSTISQNNGRPDGSNIFNDLGGTLVLVNSTVSDNVGGGIWTTWNSTVTLTNSTVSNAGGAWSLFIWNGGAVTLTNSTVLGNVRASTETDPGDPPAAVSLVSSATVIDGACVLEGPDAEWTNSNGYNIESLGDTCGFDQGTDQVNVSSDDLKLGELADNGGPTMTHALGAGSVAIDWIPADMCEADEDQRGVTRPQGDACDVGAVEMEVAP
jgi:hypothetical protein